MKLLIIGIMSLLLITGCTTICPEVKCPTCNCDEVVTGTNLDVYVIDVGQGDASLIKYGDTEMLIDCGMNSKGPELIEFLESKGVTELEYLLITHPDADHLGGCDDVLKHITTHAVIMNGEEKDTVSYQEVMDEIDTENLVTASMGDSWMIGPATMEVLQADNNIDDSNQNSIVTKLVHNEFSMLFTGDCDRECEDLLINKDIGVDILRVAHHGSKFATEIDFLEKANPSIGIISVGDNSYGHPTQETLDRLSQEGVVLYRTDYDGDIRIESDGVTYNIE